MGKPKTSERFLGEKNLLKEYLKDRSQRNVNTPENETEAGCLRSSLLDEGFSEWSVFPARRTGDLVEKVREPESMLARPEVLEEKTPLRRTWERSLGKNKKPVRAVKVFFESGGVFQRPVGRKPTC